MNRALMNERSTTQPGAAVNISADSTLEPSEYNFAFVMNVSRLGQATGFTLAPGHQLRRAKAHEISTIEKTIQDRVPNREIMPFLWNQRITPEGRVEPLPEDEWRYFVIAFQGTNQTLEELAAVFSLAPLELKIAFTVLQMRVADHASRGLISHASRLFHQLEDARWGRTKFVEVNASDVDEITAIHTRLRQHSHTLLDVNRYTRALQELQGLPPTSPLLFLGYFGLLEALLTHQPDPKDPLDSITRQVKNKVALLDNRFQRRLDYSPFAATNPDTIWTRMYDYRSRLAHGSTPDFQAN
jgi:hypothetical protein